MIRRADQSIAVLIPIPIRNPEATRSQSHDRMIVQTLGQIPIPNPIPNPEVIRTRSQTIVRTPGRIPVMIRNLEADQTTSAATIAMKVKDKKPETVVPSYFT